MPSPIDLVHDASLVAHGVHHPLQHGVEDHPALLETAVGEQLQRAPQVGEQDGEEHALPVEGSACAEQALAAFLVLQRPRDAPEEPLRVVPLLEVIGGPELHGLLGRLPAGVPREHDHVGFGTVDLRGAEHVEARTVRHPEVGDHDVGMLVGQGAHGGGHAVGLAHSMAEGFQEHGHGQAQGGLVVDNEDRGHGALRGLTSHAGQHAAHRARFRPGHGESIPYSLHFRQRVVRPMPSASAARE